MKKNGQGIPPEMLPADPEQGGMTEEIVLRFSETAELRRLPESPAEPEPPLPVWESEMQERTPDEREEPAPAPTADPEPELDPAPAPAPGSEPELDPAPEPEPEPKPESAPAPETSEKAAEARENSASAEGEAESKPAEEEPASPGAFYASLIALRAEDIAPKRKRSPAEILRFLVRPTAFLLCMAVFFYAAYTVIFNVITYRIADERYRQLAGNFSMEAAIGAAPLPYKDDAVTLPDFAGMLSGDFEYKQVDSQTDGSGAAVYRADLPC